ncbi:MAG: DUF4139 domain-containing protein [Candidatus Hydrogenedentes bacterium]|nr:DUF4139 domain-containing protein [Candidatus Hydrogenedentota bacterium]
MRTTHTAVVVALIGLAPCAGWAQAPGPRLSDRLDGVAAASQTTISDQSDVAVTIYNNDLALVRDRRKVPMLPGEQSLAFMDVPERILPQTVSLRSISAPGSLRILEQNYEYDLMSPAKMMEKYVGQDVRLVNFSREIGFTEVEATLLSVNDGPIYRTETGIYLGHPGVVALPEVPDNLIAKPSLLWILDNDTTDQELEATFLTNGMGWTADYVVTLDQSDAAMDLEGWVTLDNRSGAQYTDAQLKLVAGEVHVAPPPAPAPREGLRAMAKGAAPVREEAFAEYHLYTLSRRTTIKNNQSKQVSLLSASGAAVQKHYELRGSESFFLDKRGPVKDLKVAVFLAFQNAEANKLGLPLPAGVMRVYQEDRSGMLQFVGEDRIDHTPKDEEVRLRLGNAFDIVGERVQTDFQRIADRVTESAYRIAVRNHKAADVDVDIIEPMPGDWAIRDASHAFDKRDAHTAVFRVSVPKDGEAVVTYRVRVTF